MLEILDGKNVYDFLDFEIVVKLQVFEEEEEKLENEGFYNFDDEEEIYDGFEVFEVDDIKEKVVWIRNR